MRTSSRTASFWSIGESSFLIHVFGSRGSVTHPTTHTERNQQNVPHQPLRLHYR